MKLITFLALVPAVFAIPGTVSYLDANKSLRKYTFTNPAQSSSALAGIESDQAAYLLSIHTQGYFKTLISALKSANPSATAVQLEDPDGLHGAPTWWTRLPDAQQSVANSINRQLYSDGVRIFEAAGAVTRPATTEATSTRSGSAATVTTAILHSDSTSSVVAATSGASTTTASTSTSTGGAAMITPVLQVAIAAVAGGAALLI